MTGWLGALLALTAPFTQTPQDIPPDLPREARGVWVATVGNVDWPSQRGLPPEKQKAEAEAILDRAAHMRLNMVVLQVRPAADALYKSAIFPWSPYLTGWMGTDPGYDPLAFWIEEAHKRGIELHAWINPYRALTTAGASVSSNHVSSTRPDLVRNYAGQLWLDPGEADCQKLIVDGIKELVTNYDLDGIHFDDYFYPYPVGSETFPDDSSYAKAVSEGNPGERGTWRRANVDSLVESVHDAIHQIKPWVKFGISPFGIWKPGYPSGVWGLDPTTTLYSDSREWLQNGWVDYLSPQLYWKISAPKQPFGRLLKWWLEQDSMDRHIWPGCYDSNSSWPAQEVVGQVKLTRALGGGGNLHFSARVLMKNVKGLATMLRERVYASPALVPASPWLKAEPPVAPKIGRIEWDGIQPVHFEWTSGDETPRFWLVAMRYGSIWSYRVLSGEEQQWDLPGVNNAGALQRLDIAAIDPAENQGPWTEVPMPVHPIGGAVGR